MNQVKIFSSDRWKSNFQLKRFSRWWVIKLLKKSYKIIKTNKFGVSHLHKLLRRILRSFEIVFILVDGSRKIVIFRFTFVVLQTRKTSKVFMENSICIFKSLK